MWLILQRKKSFENFQYGKKIFHRLASAAVDRAREQDLPLFFPVVFPCVTDTSLTLAYESTIFR